MIAAPAERSGHDGTTRPCSGSRGSGRLRRRVLTAAVVGVGLLCGLLAGPAAAFPAGKEMHPPAGKFPPTGKTWEHSGSDVTETYRVMTPRQGRRPGTLEHYAVRIWQELLNEHGLQAQITGLYEQDTARAVRAFQSRRGMPVTGRIDYPTARALLERTIKREAAAVGISPDLLCGHLDLESRLDPKVVGPSGDDLGLGQILMGRWNPGIGVAEAMDEDFAIRYMARRDAAAYRHFGDWRIAVFDYNYPVGAHAWKRTGTPSSRGRWYSETVFRGCSGPEFPGERVTTITAPDDRQVLRESSADLGRWLHEVLASVGNDWEMSSGPTEAAKPATRESRRK